MKERIIWIDWAKALAVCCVVFCHLPQSQDWFYYRYLQADIITIFFFISGYLKKDHGSDKANWQKYWHSLILPYLFYNVIVYPYWLVRFYMLNDSMPDLFQAMRPILGSTLVSACYTLYAYDNRSVQEDKTPTLDNDIAMYHLLLLICCQ